MDGNTEKVEKSVIEYNKLGGRPSMRIKINGIWKNCLLDTGARINVIDEEVAEELREIHIRPMIDNVPCTNGRRL